MMLAPVLVVLAIMLAKARQKKAEYIAEDHAQAMEMAGIAGKEGYKQERTKITIPYFAIGFIVVIAINTFIGEWCGASTVKEIPLNGAIEYLDTFLLTMAMTALGTDTSLDKFKQAGAKPFLLAFLLFIWLLVGGYYLALYVPQLLA